MRVFRPSILKWFVTGLFAAVAIAGQALHDLPGCGHAPCGGHCSPACGGDGSNAAFQPGHDSPRGEHSAADCAICKFFGQAKILGDVSLSGDATPLVAPVPALAAAFDPTSPLRAFDARGPPAARRAIV